MMKNETVPNAQDWEAWLQSAVVLWSHMENGAPFIGGHVRNKSALRSAASPEELHMEPLPIEQPTATEIADALRHRLSSTALPPGRYRYSNPIVANLKAGRESVPISDIAEEDYGLYKKEQVEFIIKTEHIQLLKHSNVYRNAPGIDAKRPYGYRSAMHLDMAEILGIPYDDSDELYNHLETLHQETQIALQVLLIYG